MSTSDGANSIFPKLIQLLEGALNYLGAHWGTLLVAVSIVMVVIGILWWNKTPAETRKTELPGILKSAAPLVFTVLALTASAAAAWTAAAFLGSKGPVFAAAAAVIVGSTSVAGSVPTSFKMVAATVGGLLAAEICVGALGAGMPATLLTVAAALTLGYSLGLGMEGGVATAATGLFAATLGPALTASVAADRILATILGSLVGVAGAWLIQRQTPANLAFSLIDDTTLKVSEVLTQMATATENGLDRYQAEELLVASRDVLAEIESIQPAVNEALTSLKYRGKTGKKTYLELSERYRVVKYAAEHANTMARTLYDATAAGVIVPSQLAPVIEAVGQAWTHHVTDADTRQLEAVIGEANRLSKEASGHVRGLDDTQELLMSASLLADMSRIMQAPRGDVPAIEVPDSRIDQPSPLWTRMLRADNQGSQETPIETQTLPELGGDTSEEEQTRSQ